MIVPRWLFLAASLTLVPISALAQQQPNDTGRAVELGRAGKDSFDRGDMRGAFDAFASAEQIAHSPVFVLFMARAKRGLGDLLAARDLYTRAATEALSANVPEPWKRAQSDAAQELAALESRIPTVTIMIRGEGQSEARVLLDGAAVAPSALGTSLRMNPGNHTIEVKPRTGAPIVRSFELVEAAPTKTVVIDLPPASSKPLETPAKPLEPPPPPPPPSQKPPEITPPPSRSARPTAGIALISIGSIGVGVGILAGGAALASASGIKARCDKSGDTFVCPPEERGKIEGAQRLATASWIIMGAGAAIVAVGLPLYLIKPSQTTSARLSFGLGSVQINGSF